MEQCRPKILISFTFVVWSILLLKNSQSIESEDENGKWLGPPSIDTFKNYEKYIQEKNTKTPIKYESHLDDSSVYRTSNDHQKSLVRYLVKRETTSELNPKIFKFGVEDAREPDEVTKELIRKHRARHFQEKDKKAKISKRHAPKSEPRFIKFEASDAREPDEITKEIIRQSRARELKKTPDRVHVATTRSPQTMTKKLKRKRTRRSTHMSQPQFIKFELADAKEPDQNIRGMIQNMQSKFRSTNPVSQHHINTTRNDDTVVEESKKIYVYQAVPAKSKRIANAVPIEVKKIIDLMIRDSKAQAYYKYITANHDAKLKALDKVRPVFTTGLAPQLPVPVADNLVTIYPEPAYVQKLVPIPVPVQQIPVNVLPPSPQQHSTGLAPHSAIVPTAINNQNVYHPIAPLPQSQLGTTLYQQPPTYLKVIPAMTQVFKQIPTAPAVPQQQTLPQLPLNEGVSNEISKSYPYAKIIPLDASYRYGKKINYYPKVESQLIEISNDQGNHNGGDMSNQSQQKLLSQNDVNNEQQQIGLKNNQEFQELSSLIGKSPTDQFHGLAYLLAKEMQRNNRLKEQRPQDNTSPILFHPEKNVDVSNAVSPESVELPSQQELISHPLPESSPQIYPSATQHNPPVNHVTPDNHEAIAAPSPPPPPPPPTSYNVVKNLGLSPNYEGIDQFDEPPKIQPDVENGLGLQYASKYAFGYRVRDFYSGNDFGHKQNRDLDGVTRGQYHILLPDGRVQNVIYHADDTGFHADVSFETGHH